MSKAIIIGLIILAEAGLLALGLHRMEEETGKDPAVIQSEEQSAQMWQDVTILFSGCNDKAEVGFCNIFTCPQTDSKPQ